MAGIGQKWIRSFSFIVKPLTLLTRQSEQEFFFDDMAWVAFEKMKDLVSRVLGQHYNQPKLHPKVY